jgi:hypothetical protein
VLLGGAVCGSAAYVGVVTLLAHWPSIVRARGTGGAARPLLVAIVTVPLLVAAVVVWTASGPIPRRALVALAAVGFGTAWVLWGLFEQHVLRTFDVAPGSGAAAAWDSLFHGVGVLTAGVGTSLLSAASLGGHPRGIT